jgi:hypothetical protein
MGASRIVTVVVFVFGLVTLIASDVEVSFAGWFQQDWAWQYKQKYNNNGGASLVASSLRATTTGPTLQRFSRRRQRE